MAENTKEKTIKARPPVVVVLGHVDHGKTKLLDTIRKTKVAEKESGGITQHVGAYQIDIATSDKRQAIKRITFLDTPGHEAFSAIRSRGAKIADIAILVVAADESVKPQTKEAIKIVEAEKIPLIVAINKIDKEGANSQKVKQDLAAENILVEDWGGKVPSIEISAKDNRNIPELLEMILLVAELEELKEDTDSPASGVIIESRLDKRRGYLASVLVQKGIVKLGDWIVAGTVIGKIKSMEDSAGALITEARPSQPVLITGWPSAPNVGKIFAVTDSKEKASRIAEDNVDLTPLFLFIKEPMPEISESTAKKRILNLVLKADFSGSLEAVDSALNTIKSEEVGYNVVRYDIGNITEADVKSAIHSNGQIVGFRVNTEESAQKIADKESVKISSFDVIYDLVEYIRKELGGLLEPEIERTQLGRLKVLATFKKDARSQIIGGKVMSGKITRGGIVEVFRNGTKIALGKIGQLQQNKADSSEVKEGQEAGIRFDPLPNQPSQEIKEGDILEVYEEKKIERTL